MSDELEKLDTRSVFSSVLLIEDELAHAKLIERALENYVGEIQHVSNGREAVHAIENSFTELVFCDLHLPDTSGIELLKTIRAVRPTLPVVVMTSSSNLDDAITAMREGAWDYMIKHFTDDLKHRIDLVVTRIAESKMRELREQTVRAERNAFWSAVHTAQDGVAILGSEGSVVFTNPVFDNFRKLIAPDWESLGSINIIDTIEKYDSSVAEGLRNRLQAEGGETFSSSELSVKPEKKEHGAEVRTFELTFGSVSAGSSSEEGLSTIPELKRFVMWVHDITRRKEQEKFQRDLLSTTTHDLKNPLGAILASAEIIEGKMVDREKEGELITSIASCARNSINIIDELLSARRIQDGVMVVRPQQCDLNDVLDDLIIDYLPMAKSKQIEFSAKRLPGKPFVYADKIGIMRVMGNLVGNAIKFTKKGGRVEIAAVDSESSTELSVSDTGHGIEPSERTVLFERYARLSKHQDIEGTGLGLFVAKNIVDAHNGSITVESEVGVGTKFTVSFPKAQ